LLAIPSTQGGQFTARWASDGRTASAIRLTGHWQLGRDELRQVGRVYDIESKLSLQDHASEGLISPNSRGAQQLIRDVWIASDLQLRSDLQPKCHLETAPIPFTEGGNQCL
jgi:hypothetical protein